MCRWLWYNHSEFWIGSVMIRDGMDITIEAGAFENDNHKGERARVIKVIRGIFAVFELENGEVLGCFTDCVQPRMTAHNAELTAEPEGASV